MKKKKISVVERQGRRYGYAGKYAGSGRKMSLKDVFGKGAFGKLPASCREEIATTGVRSGLAMTKRGVIAGGACTGTMWASSPTNRAGSPAGGCALRGEIVEPWEDVERMCSVNQERRRMREAQAENRARMQAQSVRDRKARRKARLLEGIRTAVTVLLFLAAFYGLLCCLVTQIGAYGLGAAASLLIGGRVCG